MVLGERSVTSVLQDIVGNVQAIVRSEVRLAKLEVREEAVKAKGAALLLGVGALCGAFAMLFLLWTIVYALAIAVPFWIATLIVTFLVGIAAGLTLKIGVKRLQAVNPPDRTIETMKENAQWIKQAKQQIK
jgi:uncharacterized membrane protein YqjE